MRCNRSIPAAPSPRPKSRPGFSLVELLVVVGILAVLVSILIPVVSRAKKQARNVQCLANLRSLETALIGFINTNKHSVDYAPVSTTIATAPTNRTSLTWEGALRPMYSNDAVRVCPEASSPSDKPLGTATLAHGTQKPILPTPTPDDTYSYGSYGINGYLYYQNPAQGPPIKAPPAITAGVQHVAGATVNNMATRWFEDVTTLDGGAVPTASVPFKNVVLPPGFGTSGSVPAFGDCIDLDAWPASDGGGTYDPTPTKNYSLGTGDPGNAKGHSLGRFCLARHPHGVNIVFLDGHATTVPWAELWRLRWNKAFVPVTVTDVLFNDN